MNVYTSKHFALVRKAIRAGIYSFLYSDLEFSLFYSFRCMFLNHRKATKYPKSVQNAFSFTSVMYTLPNSCMIKESKKF